MSKDPRRLSEVLGEGRLAGLRAEVARRRKATIDVRARLPAEEAAHVVSASMEADGRLVLVLDSPAWAARLRYRSSELGFASVDVKVRPRGE